MNLTDFPIKRAYSSDLDDILTDFYIPALSASTQYDRIAGFFSSSSLAIASRGILGLIKNNGIMRLIVSPKIKKADLQIILKSKANPEQYIEKNMLDELSKFENEFVKDHLYALGWMIANNRLEIKVALIAHSMVSRLDNEEEDTFESGLFHQKVGLLRDSNNNALSFSGSINETATAWLDNIEEFKVFRSWEPFEREYIEADIRKFTNFWEGLSEKVKVFDIPTAVKKKLIEIAPTDINKLNLEKWNNVTNIRNTSPIQLFDHQLAAVDQWFSNNMLGIFEMATGTGKTFTALGCIRRIQYNLMKYVAVITCPKNHLVQQWVREIEKFGLEAKVIIADSSNSLWRSELTNTLIDISLNYVKATIIVTTHTTFVSAELQGIIAANKYDTKTILIADEVHGLGAAKSKLALTNIFDHRLGLSATPKRWFDDAGTATIYAYFGDVVFNFDLRKAINTVNPITKETYLVPYKYIPLFTPLEPDELDEYMQITSSIVRAHYRDKNDANKVSVLDLLRFKRANIVKKAKNKLGVLTKILVDMPEPIKWLLIYCESEQIDIVMDILHKEGVDLKHRFTMQEGIKPERQYGWLSQRDFLLKQFGEGKYQVLVAMKCLDEGVDIPPARTAILMASSSNPREYIQRIGRVIRRYPQKYESTIYDIIISPNLEKIPKEFREFEQKIFQKEIERCEEIAANANNSVTALKAIYDIRNR